ncbi:methyltransferase domain-containing protein [Synechococcus sp. Cruz CV-v-12]|nr:methyltransferase domain-containing protein [Synechococcus sp. Cruz CV-v-12]
MAAGRAYKARALTVLDLKPGSSALEVAGALGDDVARIKAFGARAVGVDRSRTLIAVAQWRHAVGGCEFTVADAAGLPFAEGSFDAVRVGRALQHIPDPGRVVSEMARVACGGGVVLCAEPDWGSFLLGGGQSPLTERIQHDWIRTFQNPWIGRELPIFLSEPIGWAIFTARRCGCPPMGSPRRTSCLKSMPTPARLPLNSPRRSPASRPTAWGRLTPAF